MKDALAGSERVQPSPVRSRTAARLRDLEHEDPPVLARLYMVARRLIDRARAAARGQGPSRDSGRSARSVDRGGIGVWS